MWAYSVVRSFLRNPGRFREPMLHEVALDFIQGQVAPAIDMAARAVDERVAGVRVAKLQIAFSCKASKTIGPQLLRPLFVRPLSFVCH